AVIEDRAGGQGVLQEGDGAGVDVEYLAVDVPGVVAGQVADHGAHALRRELLELRGAGGAGARPLLGDGGGEAGPGAGGDGVAGYAVAAHIAGDDAGQARYAGLRGAVVRLAGVTPE